MDIYSYEGEKVRLIPKRAVEAAQRHKDIEEYLTVDEEYTVDFVWIGSSYSQVFFKELPEVPFNTVYFENLYLEGRRDGIFSTEFEKNSDFKRYISRILPNNIRVRFGPSSSSLNKEQVFAYFNDIPYDRDNVIALGRKDERVQGLMRQFRHSKMETVNLICIYRDLVFFHYWNGPNQFIEFFDATQRKQ